MLPCNAALVESETRQVLLNARYYWRDVGLYKKVRLGYKRKTKTSYIRRGVTAQSAGKQHLLLRLLCFAPIRIRSLAPAIRSDNWRGLSTVNGNWCVTTFAGLVATVNLLSHRNDVDIQKNTSPLIRQFLCYWVSKIERM